MSASAPGQAEGAGGLPEDFIELLANFNLKGAQNALTGYGVSSVEGFWDLDGKQVEVMQVEHGLKPLHAQKMRRCLESQKMEKADNSPQHNLSDAAPKTEPAEESTAAATEPTTTRVGRIESTQQTADANSNAPDNPVIAVAVQQVLSSELSIQIEGTRALRRLLATESASLPIQAVIDAGVIPPLISFLDRTAQPDLQLEAAWALANVVSGDFTQTQHCTQQGVIPAFLKLLQAERADVREQALWGLGNISGDSVPLRDEVLAGGHVVESLRRELASEDVSLMTLTITRVCTWLFSNLCRGKPKPDVEQLRPMLPTLERMLHTDDSEVLSNCGTALAALSDGNNEDIQVVVDLGVIPRLVKLMEHHEKSVKREALRVLGNVVSGTEEQTQAVIDAGALPVFMELILDNSAAIRKDSWFAISNVMAGTEEQVQAMFDCNFKDRFLSRYEAEAGDVQQELLYAVANASSPRSLPHIQMLMDGGCMQLLASVLQLESTRMSEAALEALENVLLCGHDCDQPAFLAGARESGLEATLTDIRDSEVDHATKADDLLERFFLISNE